MAGRGPVQGVEARLVQEQRVSPDRRICRRREGVSCVGHLQSIVLLLTHE